MPNIENSDESDGAFLNLKKLSRIGCGIIVLLSILVLLGWSTNIGILKSILPGFPAMNPLEAVLFTCAGIALFCQSLEKDSKRTGFFAILFSLVTLTIGVIIFIGFFISFISLDKILFAQQLAGNRIALNTCVNFILIGVALLSLKKDSEPLFHLSQFATLSAGVITIFAMIGYFYNVLSLYSDSHFLIMSLNSACAFSLLCAGILISTPQSGVVKIFTVKSRASALARFLFIFVIIFPILMGYFVIVGQQSGAYSYQTGTALTVVISIIILTSIVWWNTHLLYKDEQQKKMINENLRKRTHDLEDTQKTLTAKYQELESAKEKIRDLLNHEEKLKNILNDR